MIFECSSGFSPRNDGFVKAREVEFDYAIKCPVLLLKYFVPIKAQVAQAHYESREKHYPT